jgi:hypothetical protein
VARVWAGGTAGGAGGAAASGTVACTTFAGTTTYSPALTTWTTTSLSQTSKGTLTGCTAIGGSP